MRQSPKHSFIEAAGGSLISYTINVILMFTVYPLFGFNAPFLDALLVGLGVQTIFILKAFLWRRFWCGRQYDRET